MKYEGGKGCMLNLKHRRRMVRNPYMSGMNYYPYQGFNPKGQPIPQQNMYVGHSYTQGYQSQQPYYFNNQNSTPFFMPYPKPQGSPVPQQLGGMQSILSQFKTKEGGYDFNKMMNTAGQMIHTVNQLNGMVKQVGSLFKAKV
jgi:hypothetical protein